MNRAYSSEDISKELLDLIPVGIILLGLHGTILFWNKKSSYIFHKAKRQTIGTLFKDLFQKNEKKHVQRFIKKAFLSKRQINTVFEIKTDSLLLIEATAIQMAGIYGSKGIMLVLRDVTDRIVAQQRKKQAEEELLESKNQLEVIFRSISEAITVQNAKGKLIYANDAACKLIGFPNSDAMTRASPSKILERFQIMDENGNPFPYHNLPENQILQGKMPSEITLRYRVVSSGEYKWAVLKASPVYDNRGRLLFIISVIIDITEKKELERRKDEFIGIASHELKTPLTSIKAYAQILQKQFLNIKDGKTMDYLSKIDSQVNKITLLIKDLLDVSKISAGKLEFRKEEFEIDTLVKEIVEDIQGTTDNHKIVVVGSTKKGVRADKDRIGQVLINLLTNAIKYSPKADKVLVHLSNSNGRIKIGVQDFGVGISEIDKRRIFDRFVQIKSSQKESFPSLGLGLYISSEIIKRHKGKIWVKSSVGSGSTFYFTI